MDHLIIKALSYSKLDQQRFLVVDVPIFWTLQDIILLELLRIEL